MNGISTLNNYFLKIYPLLKRTNNIPFIGKWVNEYKHNIIKESIIKDFSNIIEEYKNINPITGIKFENDDNYPIWVFWWQGDKNMPKMVEICYKSILENANNHPVHLITKDNINQYTNNSLWNNEILNWLKTGKIIYAHFSDILRCFLLYSYGGCWIDATVLLTKPINDFISSQNLYFYSGRRSHVKNNIFVPKGLWTCFFIYSKSSNPLLKFIYEVLCKEIEQNTKMRDYFLQDYCFVIAYEQIPYVKKIVDDIPPIPNQISILINKLNQPFNHDFFSKLISSNPFLKTTYKLSLIEQTPKMEQTYYGYLKQKYIK